MKSLKEQLNEDEGFVTEAVDKRAQNFEKKLIQYFDKNKSRALNFDEFKEFIELVVTGATGDPCEVTRDMTNQLKNRKFVHLCESLSYDPRSSWFGYKQDRPAAQKLYDKAVVSGGDDGYLASTLIRVCREFENGWNNKALEKYGVKYIDDFGDEYGHIANAWYKFNTVDVFAMIDNEEDEVEEFFISVK